jgi:beta-lactamase class D OXA-29
MQKSILFLSFGFFFNSLAIAETKCFVVEDTGQIIKQEGSDCQTRYAPESTFKIALSLMGFDTGILQDEVNPKWPYKEEYDYFINVCKGVHNPRT